MTNLKEINQLLQGEINSFYGFDIGEIYYNTLEHGNTYEHFRLKTSENSIYLNHISGKLFKVELNGYESIRCLEISSEGFNSLRQFSIKNLLRSQIETYNKLIEDNDDKIKRICESNRYYKEELEKACQLLENLEGENK